MFYFPSHSTLWSQLSDLTTFLPHPTSRDYPIQALGLQILLDQVPRSCLPGIDERWISGYFDELSVKAIDQLYNTLSTK